PLGALRPRSLPAIVPLAGSEQGRSTTRHRTGKRDGTPRAMLSDSVACFDWNGERNSRQLEPGGRLVASFGEAPASRVSRRDCHYDVHYRPTLVRVTFEPWRPGLPI